MSTAAAPTVPNKATHELLDLTIEEGSPVDQGDNPPARIALLKNKDGTTPQPDGEPGVIAGFIKRAREWAGLDRTDKEYGMARTTGQIMAMDTFRDQFWKARMALVESMNSILECAAPEEVGPLMATSVAEFTSIVGALGGTMTPQKRAEVAAIIAEMTGALKDQKAVKRRQLVDAVERLEDFSFIPVSPAIVAAPAEDTNKEQDAMSIKTNAGAGVDSILGKLSAEDRKAMDAHIAAQVQDATAKAAAKVEPPKEDPALKNADPALVKRFEAMEKASAEQAAKIATLEAEKVNGDIAATARKISRDVPSLDVSEVTQTLLDAQKSGGKDGLARAEKMLSGLAAMAKKGEALTRTMGRARKLQGQDDSPRTADDVVSVKAREMMKTDKALTFEGAYARVMRDSPSLASAAIHGAEVNTDA